MTLKTNENWRMLTCYAIVEKGLQGRAIEIEGQDVLDLCHDADEAQKLEDDYLLLDYNFRLLEDSIADLRAKLDEAYGLLSAMFIAYEDGADCYEDPEEQLGYLGKVIKLDDADECRIEDFLNGRALKEQ